MDPAPFDLHRRQQALEEIGFVVVEKLPDGFVAHGAAGTGMCSHA